MDLGLFIFSFTLGLLFVVTHVLLDLSLKKFHDSVFKSMEVVINESGSQRLDQIIKTLYGGPSDLFIFIFVHHEHKLGDDIGFKVIFKFLRISVDTWQTFLDDG
jgi:hypothetical protein